VIGCGKISAAYLEIARRFPILDIVSVSDQFVDRAQARAIEFGVPRACSVEELLADPGIEIVLNLTIPQAHADVARAVLEHGKHVYNEKPLAVELAAGRELLRLAERVGRRVGCAPDTFLGGGIQTCRELIDAGEIGEPVAATAFMANHGPEHWHPDPAFYYQPGAGPMFDMGPYYLTALVSLIGPIRRVTGSTRISFAERTVSSEPKRGETIRVNTPTHVAGLLDFANGAVGTIVTSFDVWGHDLPRIEIYGSKGTLSVPDPNTFGGPVRLRIGRAEGWTEIPVTRPNVENSRSLGLADMADGIRNNRPHRASGALAYHVLEAMHGFLTASTTGRHVDLTSPVERPAALSPGDFAAKPARRSRKEAPRV
jgi:predicted dehydrogenase